MIADVANYAVAAGKYVDDVVEGGNASIAGSIEQHHQLPQQYRKHFEKVGLDIEEYKIPLEKADHRLKPDGLHTGSNNWNKQWKEFFEKYPNATHDQILEQLDSMRNDFGII